MLDKLNLRIIEALTENARVSYAEIAKQVHLSAPAVAERVKKLEEAGVITGYKPVFNLEQLGINIEALVECKVHSTKERDFRDLLATLEEVIKVYTVTGDAEFVVQLGVTKMSELESVLTRMTEFADTSTRMVLSTPHDNMLPNTVLK